MIPLLTNAPLNNRAQDFRHPFNTENASVRVNLLADTDFNIPFPTNAAIATFEHHSSTTLLLSPITIPAFPALNASDTGIYKSNPHVHVITTPELHLFSPSNLLVVVNFYSR